MSEQLVRMRAPASMGGEYAMVPAADVDHWRKQGAVVAPEQTLGEFASRATRSVNPVEVVRGVSQAASHPVDTASGLASLPGTLAGQAYDEFKQGNYLKAARKGFTAALPIAGGVGGAALGLAGGPAGAIAGGLAGYAGGSGLAAGLDEGVDQLEQGNVATGSGALVDASLQGLLGARAASPRPTSASANASALERKASNLTARTLGPTVGPNRYAWGNEARKVGPEVLRRTKSTSREGLALEVEAMRQRYNDALNGAYDVTPPGVRMKTANVKLGLREEIKKLSVQTKNGRWVPLEGNADRVAALGRAYAELDRLGPTLDAKNIRTLRQSWDKLAEQVWEPKTNAGWDKVRGTGKGYAAARDALNEQTMQVYPHLKPQAADASFSIKASDLMRQLEETETARSKVGRNVIAGGAGAIIGSQFGGLGAGVGAMVGPAVEWLLVEKVAPSVKIRAARTMTTLADELRQHGQSARAVTLAQELRNMAGPAAATGRGGQAVGAREAIQPLAADAATEEGAPVASAEPSAFDQQLAGWQHRGTEPGPTTMRAPTWGERLKSGAEDVVGGLARQPLGQLTDAVGLSDFAGEARRMRGEEPPQAVMGAIPDAPGLGLGKKLASKAAKFAFAATDTPAVQQRMAMFKPKAPFSFAKLPQAAKPKAIYDAIMAKGGYSVQPSTGQLVAPNAPGPAMAGRYPNQGKKGNAAIPLATFRQMDVEKFMLDNRATFASDKKAFVGGWVDKTPETGPPMVYLDISRGHLTEQGAPDLRAATKFAEAQKNPTATRDAAGKMMPRGQKAIFNPETDTFPEVGNLYEFLQSPEFRDRVTAMAKVGRQTMVDAGVGDHPEWWNIMNGPMAEAYGKENIEALAGYIASTSPQNGPVANLKMATELMRRHLKGTPVRDKAWRAPSTAMGKVDDQGNRVFLKKDDKKSGKKAGDSVSEGFAPGYTETLGGQKFPNLTTYAKNAEKVQAGQASTVSEDKVNDMFHALIGKLVGVYDRHWAKIAEDPARGIYADVVENRLAGSMETGKIEAYPVIENAVRDAAKAAGVDVSTYSAWVWEGIRSTIRSTGELFGQTHRASAIPETTTGFNEIFVKLVDAKAKHLGITVPELYQRLRAGDAELLAALISTPIGAAAYARWRSGTPQPTREAGGT